MPSDKAAYLAAHYLNAEPTKPAKKRKRKHTSATNNGLLIQDDDSLGWSTKPSHHNDDKDDPEAPVMIAGTSAEFRRAKKSAWTTVSSSSAPNRNPPIPNSDDASAADAIIASVAAEKAAAARLADGDPDPDSDPDAELGKAVPMMSDGTHAGLQSAKAITAQLQARQEMERAELVRLQAEQAGGERGADEGEVILRDATGRRVDAAMRRAEMRRAQAEAERAEEERKRVLKGEVQLEEARRRREALENAALMPLARGKDDVEINREMKAEQRWNDPMTQFMGEDNRGGGGKSGGKRKEGQRPLYKGPAAPNRYGIRPGYRWDGVDRGNGFEAERFKAINRRERNKGLEYAWQMDE